MTPVQWLVTHNVRSWEDDLSAVRFIHNRIKDKCPDWTREQRREAYQDAISIQRMTRSNFYATMRSRPSGNISHAEFTD